MAISAIFENQITLQRKWKFSKKKKSPGRGGGGALPYKRLMEMCHWMGSHFHDWIYYNGVAFSIVLLEWGRTFSDFCGKKMLL